jgi:hypothetical protein
MLESVLQFFNGLVKLHPEERLTADACLSPPILVDATLENIKDRTVSANKQHQNAISRSFSAFDADGKPESGMERVFDHLRKRVDDRESLVLDNGTLICSPVVSTRELNYIDYF